MRLPALRLPRLARRRGPTRFQQAAEGSMSLIDHLRELRTRLFRATLGVFVGLIVGWFLAEPAFAMLKAPYCALDPGGECQLVQLGVADGLVLKLKIALWVGLIVSAPVWLYQLWAFVAPGLHRHERRWAYAFITVAVPLFAAGATLAYLMVDHGMKFLLEAGVTGVETTLELMRYVSFITTMMLAFGVGFEIPLLLLMLNIAGVLSGRRMLGWWRIAVFVAFAFAAVATPDPGPFGMILFAACLILLYGLAAGVALLNDKRRGRRAASFDDLSDDEASPLDTRVEPVAAADGVEVGAAVDPASPVESPAPVARPRPLDSRFDEMT